MCLIFIFFNFLKIPETKSPTLAGDPLALGEQPSCVGQCVAGWPPGWDVVQQPQDSQSRAARLISHIQQESSLRVLTQNGKPVFADV